MSETGVYPVALVVQGEYIVREAYRLEGKKEKNLKPPLRQRYYAVSRKQGRGGRT